MSDEPNFKFFETTMALLRLVGKQGETAENQLQRAQLLHDAMQNAPDDFKAAVMAQVKQNGLLPDSSHVDANGQPVYTLQQLAQHYGVSEAEIKQTLGKKYLKADLHTGPVFPLQ